MRATESYGYILAALDLLITGNSSLTLSQMTNFRLFQTERVCRRQF